MRKRSKGKRAEPKPPTPGGTNTPVHPFFDPASVGLTVPPDGPQVVAQAELAKLLELDEKVAKLLRKATAIRRRLAPLLFGGAPIEPGPLAVIMDWGTDAPSRRNMRTKAYAAGQVGYFLMDDRDYTPLRIDVAHHVKPPRSRGKKSSGLMGDPRKLHAFGFIG